MLDLDAHQPADELGVAGEVNESVLTRPPGHMRPRRPTGLVVVGSWLHDRIDEDLDYPADPIPISSLADSLLDRQQGIQPAALVARRDIVGQPGRRRARAGRVRRREDLVVANDLE